MHTYRFIKVLQDFLWEKNWLKQDWYKFGSIMQ